VEKNKNNNSIDFHLLLSSEILLKKRTSTRKIETGRIAAFSFERKELKHVTKQME
jgi:hypothetical protein